jgi:hypothetical protein
MLWWDSATCSCLCRDSSCEFRDTGRKVNLDPKSIESLPPGGNVTKFADENTTKKNGVDAVFSLFSVFIALGTWIFM